MGKQSEQVDIMAVVDGVNNMLFKFTGPAAGSFTFPSTFTTSKVKIQPLDQMVSTEYMPWGTANNWPDLVLAETAKNAYACSLLEDKIIPSHYSRGIYPVIMDEETGQWKIFWTPEIKLFWKMSNVQRLVKQFVHDFEWHKNYFPEYVLDSTGRKISYVKRHSPFKSRWELMDKNGVIKNLMISSDFPNQQSEGTIANIECLDYDLPYYDFLNRTFSKGSFTAQFCLRNRNKDYYDEAGWHALIVTWLPIANSVPEIKKKVIEKNMTLQFQIEVPMEYFRKKAEIDGHAKLTAELMTKYFTEFKDMINKYLSGVENAGKSLITPTDYYVKNGKEAWTIKIIPIESKVNDAAFLSDNYQANVEIAQGMGVDVSLTGRTKGGAEDGSGSGKFQAQQINLELQHYRREQTASWLTLVKQINNWPEEIEFMYLDFDSMFNNPKKEDKKIEPAKKQAA